MLKYARLSFSLAEKGLGDEGENTSALLEVSRRLILEHRGSSTPLKP